MKSNSTSPITRSPLSLEQLTPNRVLLEAIEGRGVTPPDPPSLIDEWESVGDPHESPTLSTSVVASNSVIDGKALLSVDIVAPASTNRTPTHLVLVVDVSGSMGCSAEVQGASER